MDTVNAKNSGGFVNFSHAYCCLVLGLACLIAAGAAWADDGGLHHDEEDFLKHCELATPGGNYLAGGACNRIFLSRSDLRSRSHSLTSQRDLRLHSRRNRIF